MLVAFIAGPFRGSNSWEVENNIRTAEQTAFKVAGLGIMPLCPHTNTRFFDGTLTDAFWLKGTSELLSRCDMVVLTEPNATRKSKGTAAEVKLAYSLNMPVFLDFEDLKESVKHD
jgi:hypothetical protein